jgi:hypothetical protein
LEGAVFGPAVRTVGGGSLICCSSLQFRLLGPGFLYFVQVATDVACSIVGIIKGLFLKERCSG